MSIDYYNKQAKKFIESTETADMTEIYQRFEKYLPPKAAILDLGSGTGRDSMYFLSKGYDVLAVDASEEMVKHSKLSLGDRVVLATFASFETDKTFDGIWACASLLHLDDKELELTIHKYLGLLNLQGVFYMSFKKGDTDYNTNERYFNCFTQDTFIELINRFPSTNILELVETADVRPNRHDEKWINAIIRKTESTI